MSPATSQSVGLVDAGSDPTGYGVEELTSAIAPFEYYIRGLTAGTDYHVTVSSKNDRCYSAPQTTLPILLAPPKQKPDIPTFVQVVTHSATSLKIFWSAPESDGAETITKYKIEWDTSSNFDSGANSAALGHYELTVSPGACSSSPCSYAFGSLVQGTPYYARVYSYNAYGYSTKAANSLPLTETPRTQAKAPAQVAVSVESATSLDVAFAAPSDNGGAPVTKYLVEWDAMGYTAILQAPLKRALAQ